MEWLLLHAWRDFWVSDGRNWWEALLQMPPSLTVTQSPGQSHAALGVAFPLTFKPTHHQPPSPFSSKHRNSIPSSKITGLEVSLCVFSRDLGGNYGNLAFVVGRWLLGNKGKGTTEGESPKWGKWCASSGPLGFESVKTWAQRPLSDFSLCKAWHNRKSQKLLSPKPCTCHISLNFYALKLLPVFFLFYR